MKLAVVATAVGAVLLALAPASVIAGPARTADATDPAVRLRSDVDAVQALRAAAEQARSAAFDARLLVIAFDTQGPSVVELEVSQSDGDLRVSRGEAWSLGRSRSQGFFNRAGELLQLGSVEAPGFRPVQLTTKYAVRSAGTRALGTGPAAAIEVVERTTHGLRERLFVDDSTGLVVRRETFDAREQPVRLAAFTQLRLRARPMRPVATPDPSAGAGTARALTPLSDESLEILADVGWEVPEQLPQGYVLQGGYALPESEGGSVHLVYSDGLYSLSLYEQFGRLDPGSLDGAVAVEAVGGHAYTWPGSQPERLVWSGDGRTFTVVSDAPEDAIFAVTAHFPHRGPSSLPGRMVRGLGRVVDWAWPFG